MEDMAERFAPKDNYQSYRYSSSASGQVDGDEIGGVIGGEIGGELDGEIDELRS